MPGLTGLLLSLKQAFITDLVCNSIHIKGGFTFRVYTPYACNHI